MALTRLAAYSFSVLVVGRARMHVRRDAPKRPRSPVQLTPRYRDPAVIDISECVVRPSDVVIRQRDRLAAQISQLSPTEWATPSRCAGWSIQDVAEHLVSVNRFWEFSLSAGMQNEPTEVLASFDPVTVPAALVESARGAHPDATLAKLTSSNTQLAALLRSMKESDWSKVAESPPGHVAMGAVCAHALWDAWVHERDVLIPLGLEQAVEPDEVRVALVYSACLGPAFYLNAGKSPLGSLSVQASDPDFQFVVEVAQQVTARPSTSTEPTAAIAGDAVELIEGFSTRLPLPPVPEEHRWLVDGLKEAFDASR